MRLKLDPYAIMPTRAHPDDAGLDLYSPIDITVMGGCMEIIDTGVHLQLPPGTYAKVSSRSSLLREGLTTDGIIDEPYRGSVGVVLFNHSANAYKVHRGDRIAQLVIMPCERPPLRLVDELDASDRGTNGFGSTGK